jgi:hypothetical protein
LLCRKPPVGKILDLPPLLAAIWAASTGWYVHFQLTGRNHRVAHAMAMVMGTRTSAEFLKRQELLREVLPRAEDVAKLDAKYFQKSALKVAREAYLDASSKLQQVPDGEDRAPVETRKREAAAELKLARAVNALQYVLNYYEFMAAGIKFGDLDERLFYETISPGVLGLCARAEPYLGWVNSPVGGREQLAFEYLKPLVAKWRTMTDADEAKIAADLANQKAAAAGAVGKA